MSARTQSDVFRYDFDLNGEPGVCRNGRWVEYDEHAFAISQLQAQLALVTAERDLALDKLQCDPTGGTSNPENIG